jgi:hypothetical protein
MADDEWYKPFHKPPPAPASQPGELLFTFDRDASSRYACELRDHGEFGIEAQFLKNGEFSHCHRWPTRAQAIAWAHAERAAIA